jgi:hypothetical protein
MATTRISIRDLNAYLPVCSAGLVVSVHDPVWRRSPNPSRATASVTDASPGQAGVSPLFEGLRAESALHEVLDATRALLWIGTPADAAEIAGRLVVGLGGAIVRAGESGDEMVMRLA